MEYSITPFGSVHIGMLILCLILGIIIFNIHKVFKNLSEERFAYIMAGFIVLLKIMDSFMRVKTEGARFIEVLPFNLCNIAILFCAYYLITKKYWIFNVFYYFSFGAIIALIKPDFTQYYSIIYLFMYFFLHSLEIILVFYIFRNMRPIMNMDYLGATLKVLTIIILFNYGFNGIFGTNYMFLNNYVIPAFRVIKNIHEYTLLIIGLYYLALYLIALLTIRYLYLFTITDEDLMINRGEKCC